MLVLNKIRSFFESKNWQYEQADDVSFVFGLKTPKASFSCQLDYNAGDNGLFFFSYFPKKASKNELSETAEFLTYMNLYLSWGGFQLDFSTRDIRFKTNTVILSDKKLKKKHLLHLIDSNIQTINKNYDILNNFLSKKINLKEAKEKFLAEVEASLNPPTKS